ncbi:uncharacterized protein LOC122073365 [Macadamia integrifolia]|uniref:uncharacterized protein LOC122073365 n=1 Tax=Macadamia integrifolia TaxID=60698 RepID=UPI001C4EC196|nr:uncharacterized protein LOC122073365 [Macadamia integrifolia]
MEPKRAGKIQGFLLCQVLEVFSAISGSLLFYQVPERVMDYTLMKFSNDTFVWFWIHFILLLNYLSLISTITDGKRHHHLWFSKAARWIKESIPSLPVATNDDDIKRAVALIDETEVADTDREEQEEKSCSEL